MSDDWFHSRNYRKRLRCKVMHSDSLLARAWGIAPDTEGYGQNPYMQHTKNCRSLIRYKRQGCHGWSDGSLVLQSIFRLHRCANADSCTCRIFVRWWSANTALSVDRHKFASGSTLTRNTALLRAAVHSKNHYSLIARQVCRHSNLLKSR